MILLHASFTILGLARYWDLGNEPSRALAPRVLLVDVLDGDSLNIVVWLRRVFLVIIGQEVFAVESAPCEKICQQRSYQQLAASGKEPGIRGAFPICRSIQIVVRLQKRIDERDTR